MLIPADNVTFVKEGEQVKSFFDWNGKETDYQNGGR
jgi:hypothetical protein